MDFKRLLENACGGFRKHVDEIPMNGISTKVRDYIRHTAGVLRAPTNFVFGEVLTVFGCMLGKRVTVEDGVYRNRCSLFSAIVGAAGSAKSPTIDHVMRPLNAIDHKNYEHFVAQYQAAKSKGEEIPTFSNQLVASNETVENLFRILFRIRHSLNGLLFHQDELLNFFGANAKMYSDGNIISNFLTIYNGFTPLNVGRVSLDLPLKVDEPFLSILGGTQLKKVDELFKGQEGNGFQSRWCLWIANEDSPLIDDGDTTHDEEWKETLNATTYPAMQDITLHFENLQHLRHYDDLFREACVQFGDAGEDELSEIVKKESYTIRRLAAAVHTLNALADGYERPAEMIKEETVEYAAALVEHLFRNAAIVQHLIEQKRNKKITGREAILAIDGEYRIKNQSMFSQSLGGKPTQQYIAKILQEAKKQNIS